MLTYSGVHVTRDFGAPTVRDIAVQAMRLPRFAGGTGEFWPVGMHLLLVADLLPKELEHHALLHDAAEVVVSDVPRPMKTDSQRKVEHTVLYRLYESLGLFLPTVKEDAEIHNADVRAVNVEGCNPLTGPQGFEYTQPGIEVDLGAKTLLEAYIEKFTVEQAVKADGVWPRLLESRLRLAIRRAQKAVDYTSKC